MKIPELNLNEKVLVPFIIREDARQSNYKSVYLPSFGFHSTAHIEPLRPRSGILAVVQKAVCQDKLVEIPKWEWDTEISDEGLGKIFIEGFKKEDMAYMVFTVQEILNFENSRMVKLPHHLAMHLDMLVEKSGQSEGEIIREAIHEYVANFGKPLEAAVG